MFKSLVCCTMLIIVATAGRAHGQERAMPAAAIEERSVKLPGTEYVFTWNDAGLQAPAGRSRADLLAAIETWLASEFNLPAMAEPPRIETVPAARMVALRYPRIPADTPTNLSANGHWAVAAGRDTVAIYSDSERTIYLRDGWNGDNPTDLSVLVHEMVHHAQNLQGLKFECPQEREKLAYRAQERWLGLFGHSLASDFELDPFSLLVKTRCLN
jgi:uncharacterized protein DUF6647